MSDEKRQYFNSIQILKLIACLIIVFGHFFCNSQNIYVQHLAVNGGGYGNNMFFIISGFLLYFSSYDTKKISVISGFKKIRKLYPLYIIMMVLWVLLDVLIFLLKKQDTSFINSELIKILLNIFLLQSFVPIASYYHSLNAVSWYLSCYLWILVFYPLVLKLIKKDKNNLQCLLIVLVIYSFIVLTNLFLNIPFKTWLLAISPFCRILYVILGSLIAKLYVYVKEFASDYLNRMHIKLLNSFVLILLLVLSFILLSTNKFSYLLLFIELLIVFVAAFESDYFSKVYNCTFLLWLSKLTPFVFLIHYVIIRYCSMVINVLKINVNSIVRYIFVLCVSVMLSWVYDKCYSSVKNRSLKIEK